MSNLFSLSLELWVIKNCKICGKVFLSFDLRRANGTKLTNNSETKRRYRGLVSRVSVKSNFPVSTPKTDISTNERMASIKDVGVLISKKPEGSAVILLVRILSLVFSKSL